MERIEFLSRLIVKRLLEEKMLLVDDPEYAISLTKALIVKDLRVEDELDEEVRGILREHADQIERERIPYHQMFRAVKEKLVKQRGLIL
jgi:hypothetical protein